MFNIEESIDLIKELLNYYLMTYYIKLLLTILTVIPIFGRVGE